MLETRHNTVKNKLVWPGDFGRYCGSFTGHRRKLWTTLTEPFGSAEPRLKSNHRHSDKLKLQSRARSPHCVRDAGNNCSCDMCPDLTLWWSVAIHSRDVNKHSRLKVKEKVKDMKLVLEQSWRTRTRREELTSLIHSVRKLHGGPKTALCLLSNN